MTTHAHDHEQTIDIEPTILLHRDIRNHVTALKMERMQCCDIYIKIEDIMRIFVKCA